MNLGLFILPWFDPSVPPSGNFFRIGSLVFLETQPGVRGPCGFVRGRAGFLENLFLSQKWENGPKIGFFEFIGEFSH